MSLILPVSGAALHHMAEQKRIPSLRIGRRVIVPRELFKKWMEQECGMAGNPSMGVMAAWCSQYTITQRESTKVAVQNRAAPWDHNHVRIYFRLHSAAAGGDALCVPRGPVRDSPRQYLACDVPAQTASGSETLRPRPTVQLPECPGHHFLCEKDWAAWHNTPCFGW